MRDVIPPATPAPPAPETADPAADPFPRLARDRRGERLLAELLERLADGLPDGADRMAARLAAAALRRGFDPARAPEAAALYPALEAAAGAEAGPMLAVARRDLAERAGLAVELAEALDALAEAGRSDNPAALGFMLRAFFDGLRRRLDWVEAALLPLAERALDAPARAALAARLDALQGQGRLRDWRGFACA